MNELIVPCPRDLVMLVEEADIKAKVSELAEMILADYGDSSDPLVLIGVLKGAYVFLADLARAMAPFPLHLDFVQTSSYGLNTKSTGNVQLIKDIQVDVHGHSVILVEDIMDSGYTVAHLRKIMHARGASSVKICSLLDKPSRRELDVHADYVGFTVANHFVVGYGMDACENYRNLPYIAYVPEDME